VSFFTSVATLSGVVFPWENFLERYRGLARNVAAGITGVRDEAEDVVQDAAAALHSALQREPDRFETLEHARNYFLRTVRNLAIKHRSKRPTLQVDEEVMPAAPVDDSFELQEDRSERLRTALLSLSEEERELIRRRFDGRETLAQVATATGVPISTLHSREKTTLSRLRRMLADDRTTGVGDQA
jgi:RNA polymerase sigma factor (sigma-70 family)